MTDAVWLLWNRALIDYAKATVMRLLTRMRRDETAVCLPPDNPPTTDALEIPGPD